MDNEDIEVETGEIRQSEVRKAIKKTKNRKEPDVILITAEMTNADKETRMNEITTLFGKVWDQEKCR